MKTKPVGPTRSLSFKTEAAMSVGLSGTTSTLIKSTPLLWRSLASHGVFASAILPERTSLPMIIKAAVGGVLVGVVDVVVV